MRLCYAVFLNEPKKVGSIPTIRSPRGFRESAAAHRGGGLPLFSLLEVLLSSRLLPGELFGDESQSWLFG